MPCADCNECFPFMVKSGPAIPVAIVCTKTTQNADDPICWKPAGVLCFSEDTTPNAPGTTHKVLVLTNTCTVPLSPYYMDLADGSQITDQAIINRLHDCDTDVTEEEVCVGLDGETFTCIKRTYYASNPVDVFIGSDGSIVTPDSWTPGTCPCDVVDRVCYQVPETIVDIASNTWEIISPTQAKMTVPVGDLGLTVTFTADLVGGVATVSDTETCSEASPDTNAYFIGTAGNYQWRISWDMELSGPFTLRIWDIDVTELVTVVSAVQPDSTTNIPSAGSGLWSTMTWNDVSLLGNAVTLDFTPTCYGFGVITTITIPEQVRETTAFISCDKERTFKDVITWDDLVLTETDIIRCAVSPSTYSQEIVCVTVGEEAYTALRVIRIDDSGETETFLAANGVEVVPDNWFAGPCEPCDYNVIYGFVNECTLYDNELPIYYDAIFSNAPVGTNTITVLNSNAAALIRNEILDAQIVEAQQIKHGLAVTPFVITAADGAVYSFAPSALVAGSDNVLTISESGIIAWGANQTEQIDLITYSTFSSCTCLPVKIVELVEDGATTLVDVLDIANYDPETLLEPSVLVNNLLPFGTTGPYPGPCPDGDQVIDLDDLCCNDNLVTGSPTIANKRLAWLDAADTLSNLLDAIGGSPIAGNDGDVVGEVLDKLGGPHTFKDGGGPNGGPYYRLDRLNDLPALQFLGDPSQGTNIADHLEIQLGAGIPIGNPFQVFYLLKPANANAPENACFLACGPNVGGQFAGQASTWQISRGETPEGTANQFVFRYNNGVTSIDIPLIPWATFANGQPHLITLFYDGTNVQVYLDGKLELSFAPTIGLYSQFFRIFGNRQDGSYPAGDLYEMYISDGTLEETEVPTINAYLICKWGMDPSFAVGGAGDLTLGPAGAYSASSPFVRIKYSDGTTKYKNTLNGQEFVLPPVPGLSTCGGGTCELCQDDVLTVVDAVATGDYTIPAGVLAYSIAIESGVATVNGAVRPTGYVISQVPMSYGSSRLRYPEIAITGVTGTIHVNYVTE